MKKMLKFIAIVLALTVAFSGNVFATDDVTATEPQENTNIILGDVSGDGKVSILDSAYVFFHVLGLRKLSEEAIAGGDVNGDGKLSFDDMSEITRYAFDIIPVFTADTKCWSINGETFSSSVTAAGSYTQEKDENGNNIYLLYEMYKKIGISEDAPFAAKGVSVTCNGNPDENEIIELSYGIDSDRIYADFAVRQMGTIKPVLNMLKMRMISENGKGTLVLPTINAYLTDLGEEINVDKFTSIGNNFNISLEKEYEYVTTYYTHSFYVVHGGTKYICEVYREPLYVLQNYFTPDGELARVEQIKIYDTNVYSITNYEYIGTEMDESMFDIPAYYVEISFEDLKKFVGNNSLAQAFFKDKLAF